MGSEAAPSAGPRFQFSGPQVVGLRYREGQLASAMVEVSVVAELPGRPAQRGLAVVRQVSNGPADKPVEILHLEDLSFEGVAYELFLDELTRFCRNHSPSHL